MIINITSFPFYIYIIAFKFSGNFNPQSRNSGKLFNYSKFTDEHCDTERSGSVSKRVPTALVAAMDKTQPSQTFPKMTGSTSRSEEGPLIDLSDSLNIHSNNNGKKSSSPSTLCLFDTLLSTTDSAYGNIELQQPLIGSTDSKIDPFEVRAELRNFVSRTINHESGSAHTSLHSVPSYSSSPSCEPLKPVMVELQKQHNRSHAEEHSSLKPAVANKPIKPPPPLHPPNFQGSCVSLKHPQVTSSTEHCQNVNSIVSSCMPQSPHSRYPKVPLKPKHKQVSQNTQREEAPPKNNSNQPVSSSYSDETTIRNMDNPKEKFSALKLQHQFSDNFIDNQKYINVRDTSKTADSNVLQGVNKKVSNLKNNLEISNANSSQVQHKIIDEKSNKAFDWLNDAISTFAVSRSTASDVTATSDATLMPSLPQYDEVPCEEQYTTANKKRNVPSTKVPFYIGPTYDEVPTEEKHENVFKVHHPVATQLVAPALPTSLADQNASDNWSWDSFDSDFDDEPDHDSGGTQASVDKKEPIFNPPPLPPRDSPSLPRKANIYPVKQDGIQLSHTHYFLIPPKGERRECTPTNTAHVKPFLVDRTRTDGHKSEMKNNLDYENISTNYMAAVKSMEQCAPLPDSSNRISVTVDVEPPYNRQASSNPGYIKKTASDGDNKSLVVSLESNPGGSGSPRELVQQVRSCVIGVTDEECHTALCQGHWNVDNAVRYLKIQQLFRLGMASREQCEKLLETLHWDLELASSILLDQYRQNVQLESSV